MKKFYLRHLKVLVPNQRRIKLRVWWNVIQKHWNCFFPPKITKNRAKARGFIPRLHLWSVWVKLFTQHLSQFRRFHLLIFGLSPLPLAKSWLSAKPGHGFWSSIVWHLCFTKFLFRKILMMSLHIICGLDPPIKNPGYINDSHCTDLVLCQKSLDTTDSS